MATRWHNPRRIFPTLPPHAYFLVSRCRDKPLSCGRRSPCRRPGNGHVKNGKLNRRRINSLPKINALYVRSAKSASAPMAVRPAFRTSHTRGDVTMAQNPRAKIGFARGKPRGYDRRSSWKETVRIVKMRAVCRFNSHAN